MVVHGYMVPFHYVSKMGQTTEECSVSRDQFNDIVISMRHNLIQIAQSLSLEIRERFPRDELLEAMSVVYCQYWNKEKGLDTLKVEFSAKLSILVHHFGRNVKVQGEDNSGILDSSKLYEKQTCFAETMLYQYLHFPKSIEYGVVIKLWTILGEIQFLQENMSEYFKLVDLCQTMILGSVEDERMFSALSFLKSKLRNKLDKNVDTCLRLYVTKYKVENFPYERALSL